MKRIVIFLTAAILGLYAASPALAAQPPGQLGSEGQPGHQAGGGGGGNAGYEGQPGNQSH